MALRFFTASQACVGIVLKARYLLFHYCSFVAGVITAALKASDALCAHYDGREALVLAGGYIADVHHFLILLLIL